MSKEKTKEAPAAAESEDGEVAPAKKKPPIMLFAVIGVVAVLVLGGGGTAAFLMLGSKGDPAAAGKEHKKPKSSGAKAEGGKSDPNAPQIKDGPDGVVFYTLPDIIVNMQTADGRPTFLKLKLTFELPDADTADSLTPNMPRLQDMFQTFLRELRPEDLAGSQGSFQLRAELLRRANLVAAPAKVNAVLIEEMLIN